MEWCGRRLGEALEGLGAETWEAEGMRRLWKASGGWETGGLETWGGSGI